MNSGMSLIWTICVHTSLKILARKEILNILNQKNMGLLHGTLKINFQQNLITFEMILVLTEISPNLIPLHNLAELETMKVSSHLKRKKNFD